MKYSVSSYSFLSYVNQHNATPIDCIDLAVKLGFDAIEFVELAPHDGSSPLEYARKLKQHALDSGIEISCFTVGADFLAGDETYLKAEIARVKEMVDIAAELGAGFMRHDATYGNNIDITKPGTFEAVLPTLAAACREVAQYAEKRGVRTMVENHGYFCQGAERVIKLHKTVDHPNFGLLCDIGNFAVIDENSFDACTAVAPYTTYVHAKDFIIEKDNNPENPAEWFLSANGTYLQGTTVGKGFVKAAECIKAILASGYDGFIAIEYEGKGDCLKGIAEGLEFLRSI